jgi:cyclopropane-fatty-acyl-phospholipid synthase
MTQTPVRDGKTITSAPSPQTPRTISQSILTTIFGPPETRNFAVRYWDGTTEGGGATPAFTLILRRPSALRRMFLPPSEMALGEAYLRDDYGIEGDMEAAAGLSDTIGNRLRSPRLLAHLARQLMTLPAPHTSRGLSAGARSPQLSGARHSTERDARAVRYHYDVGNDFYALWLDANMVYSCAYFPTGTEDLDTAQTAKMEHICRKLRLKPGERLLDIGCGWGGLIRYAAERYGVQALGVTLSEPQAEWAQARIAAAGLENRCRVEVRDYRTLSSEAPFDKVVSVGMFEHVGRARLPTYFVTAYRVLRPGGLFLNHGIAGSFGGPAKSLGQWAFNRLWKPGRFIWKYVFPDGELVPPREAITQGELAGFETRDVENLREHYTLTLRQWVRRLEARHEEAVALVGEPTYRVWRLYMAASAYSFAVGRNSLIQALFSKPGPQGASELPLTRADLYR